MFIMKKISRKFAFREILSAALGLCLLLCACDTTEEKKAAFLAKGQALLEQKDYIKAALEFKNAIQIDPKYAQAYYLLGKTELSLNNFKPAFLKFNMAAQLDPTHTESRLDMGKMLLASKKYRQAQEKADEVTAIDPDNEIANLLKAAVYVADKKFEPAKDLFEKIENQGIDTQEFYLFKNLYYNAVKNSEMALEILKKGAERFPDSLAIRTRLTDYYRKKKDFKNLELSLLKLLDMMPDAVRPQRDLAIVYFQTQQEDKALDVLNKLIEKDPEDSQRKTLAADLMIKNQQTERGLEIIRNAMEATPLEYEYPNFLSAYQMQQKDLQKAEEILQTYLSQGKILPKPGMIKARINLATIYSIQEKPDDAKAQINQVLEYDPRNITAHGILGNLYMAEGNGGEAVIEFRSVVSDDPENIAGITGLACAHALNEEYALALHVLSNALKKAEDADAVKLLKTMAEVNARKKDMAAAENNLKQIIEIEPDNLVYIADLGDFYLTRKLYDKAFAQYDQVKAKAPKEPIGYLKAALALSRMGKKDNALKELETGNKKAGPASVFLISMAELKIKQGNRRSAESLLRQVVDSEPENQYAWLSLANLYKTGGDFLKAEKEYKKLLAKHPDIWAANNNLASILSQHRKSEESLTEALHLAKKANELNPGSYIIMDTLGWVYYQKDDLEKAREWVSKAIEKKDNNEILYYHMGAICHGLGDIKGAKENLKKALTGQKKFDGRAHAQKLFEDHYQL